MTIKELDFSQSNDPNEQAAEPHVPAEERMREWAVDSVRQILKNMNYTYRLDRNGYERNQALEGRDDVIRAIVAFKQKDFKLSKPAVETALSDFEHEERIEQRDRMRVFMNLYDPAIGDNAAREFLALLQRVPAAQVSHLDAHALLSMIWQIKRKVAGHYGLDNPLMLFFSGGQGAGKTRFLTRLCQPVGVWCAGNTNFKMLRDRTSKITFSRYYVIPVNDSGKKDLRPEDVETLKPLITEPDFGARDNYSSNGEMKYDNIATCYSTSNFDVAQLISDDTGARRWWQIDVPEAPWSDELENALARFDIDRLWRSVNGKSVVNPRSQYITEYRAIQEDTLRRRGALEECVHDCFEAVADDRATLTQDEAFDHFKVNWPDYGLANLRPPRAELWKALLELAPMKRGGGTSTCVDHIYTFRRIRMR